MFDGTVQVHQIWHEIEFSGTRVQVFWAFFGQNRLFWTQDFDIEFFIQFFLLKFMFYLNLVPFFGNNLGISFEEKKTGFSIQKKLKFSRVFISKVIVFVDDLGPKCTYLYLTWKSQVQSTKYSTSTGTSTGTYFHNVCLLMSLAAENHRYYH